MTTILEQTVPIRGSVRVKRWTRDDLRRFRELGLIDPQERLELIGGEIYEKMGMNPPHARYLQKLFRLLIALLPDSVTARNQLPLVLATDGEPEPDIVVVRGTDDDYPTAHPTQDDTLLVIEVSDSTLAYDQGRKASYYAEAGIADYWIINIPGNRVEVYRNPHPDPDNEWGFSYDAPQVFKEGDTVSALNVPIVVPIMVLLPAVPASD